MLRNKAPEKRRYRVFSLFLARVEPLQQPFVGAPVHTLRPTPFVAYAGFKTLLAEPTAPDGVLALAGVDQSMAATAGEPRAVKK
jgi:hypothetical protein